MFGLPRELEESAPPRFANAVGFVVLPVATMAAYTQGSGWLAWGPGLLVAALLAAVTGPCLGRALRGVPATADPRPAPGHIAAPRLRKAAKRARMPFLQIDVGVKPEVARTYGIRSVPSVP